MLLNLKSDRPSTEAESVDLAQLADVLAHRLRGLVTGIDGFAQLLLATAYDDEQRDLSHRILEGTQQIEKILAELKQFSQPLSPHLRTIRVYDLLPEVFLAVADEDAARLTLNVKVEAHCALEVDPSLIQLALLALLNNALEATKAGGSAGLSVLKMADNLHIAFEVWNEGQLPPATTPEQLFMPFFTTKAQNLGVGLNIAQRIAQAHGGSIALRYATPQKGTSFALVLPIRNEE